MSYFLCLTKSMEKFPAGNNRNAAKGGEKSTRSVPSGRDKLSARTCKKLPVASFCASETAETGRIANGREQGDHVSRRQRFASLNTSCEGVRVVTFCIVQKVTKKHAGLRPATSIQIAGLYVIFSEITGNHQVTGFAKSCNFAGYRRQ